MYLQLDPSPNTHTELFSTSFTPMNNEEKYEITTSKPEIIFPIGNDELITTGCFIGKSDFEQTVLISSHLPSPLSSNSRLEPVRSSSDSDVPVSSDCLMPFSTMDVSALVYDYRKFKPKKDVRLNLIKQDISVNLTSPKTRKSSRKSRRNRLNVLKRPELMQELISQCSRCVIAEESKTVDYNL